MAMARDFGFYYKKRCLAVKADSGGQVLGPGASWGVFPVRGCTGPLPVHFAGSQGTPPGVFRGGFRDFPCAGSLHITCLIAKVVAF